MNADRFDELTRALATGASRRAILKGMAAAVAGGALAGLLPGQVRAQTSDACRESCLGAGGAPTLMGEALSACLRLCQTCGREGSHLCPTGAMGGPACCAANQTCGPSGLCVPPEETSGGPCPRGMTFCGFGGCCTAGTVCQGNTCVPA
jgi:hypothetical protein